MQWSSVWFEAEDLFQRKNDRVKEISRKCWSRTKWWERMEKTVFKMIIYSVLLRFFNALVRIPFKTNIVTLFESDSGKSDWPKS